MTASQNKLYQQAEERIERLTLLLGLPAAAVVALIFSVPAGLGVAIGAALAWVNSRWLRQGLDSLRDAAVGQHRPELPEASRGRVPAFVAAKLIGRYVLMALLVYVMFKFFGIPVLAILAGLCALGAAAIVEGVYEAVARPG
jgi:hypothetical protein